MASRPLNPSHYKIEADTQLSNIMYSQMASGTWNVVIQATDFDSHRSTNLPPDLRGSANTVVVTVRPTLPPLFLALSV